MQAAGDNVGEDLLKAWAGLYQVSIGIIHRTGTLAMLALIVLVSACSTNPPPTPSDKVVPRGPQLSSEPPPQSTSEQPKRLPRTQEAGLPQGRLRVGPPYTIKGVRYVPRHDPDYNEVGMASWYGQPFHGRKTASGERFDMNAMTAAHRTLPFGAWVQVTNLSNGRKLVLRVNDRGPFSKGRIIDVSKRAAEALGFRQNGIAKVRVQFIKQQRSRLEYLDPPLLALWRSSRRIRTPVADRR